MMARDGSRLFLQIQRLDRNADGTPVLPSYLAVIDIATDQVLDVDPQQPGLQAIELSGPKPSHKMHVDRTQGRLYVSEPGLTFDPVEGGIEAVDLDTLQALGYVTSESQLFVLDLGAFVMVSPVKGYVWTYTDFAALSHLTPFSRVDGSPGTTMHNSGSIVHGTINMGTTGDVSIGLANTFGHILITWLILQGTTTVCVVLATAFAIYKLRRK